MSSAPTFESVCFGSFEVDLRASELRRHGLKVKLQDQPFQILLMLLARPGQLVTREEIRQKLWPADTFVDFDRGMNNAVNRLREALGDSAEFPRFVETLPKKGYRWIAPINRAKKLPISRAPLRFTAWKSTALVALLLVIAVGTFSSPYRHPFGKRFLASTPVNQFHSIAVLPLENLSGDPSQDYIAEGVGDALTTDLAGIRSLRVISRTSATHYKGTHKTLPEIARELNVDVVVEGAVVRSGDNVRVTAQLIHAPTDRHLWAESYERKIEDLLSLQRQIALEIARKVSADLTSREQFRLTHGQSIGTEAQEAYLRGRYLLNLRNNEDIDKAPELFQLAIEKAPYFAAAYSGLADSYLALMQWEHVSANAVRGRILQAIEKSLKLDDECSEAHASLAVYEWSYERDQPTAEREFKRAISLNPSDSDAHKYYGLFLMQSGRFDEAVTEEMRAEDLDPLAAHLHISAGHVFYESGNYVKAIAEWKRVLEIDPSLHFQTVIGWAYARQGMRAEAANAWLQCWNQNFKVWRVLNKGYKAGGYEGLLRAQLSSDFGDAFLPEKPPSDYTSHYHRAVVYAELNELAKAFESITQAIKEKDGDLVELAVDPDLEKLHADPRFQELLRRCRAECGPVRPFELPVSN